MLFHTAFVVQAHTDDHAVSATAETANEAFAKAVEWQLVHKYTAIVIRDGIIGFTITQFASVMALKAIANTVETGIELKSERWAFMPLTRGEIIGYDARRMSYKFTMMDGVKKIVDCEISATALGDLVGSRWGTVQPPDRDAQFLKFRDLIEELASHLFEPNGARPVRVFAKHLPSDNRSRGG
jgi:hypothetical protein